MNFALRHVQRSLTLLTMIFSHCIDFCSMTYAPCDVRKRASNYAGRGQTGGPRFGGARYFRIRVSLALTSLVLVSLAIGLRAFESTDS